MFWNGKKVLVTGAGGFIGSHLCERLLELGANVTGMIRYSSGSNWGNLEFLPADKAAALHVVAGNVEDRSFVDHHVKGKDVVLHLAALIGIPYSYVAPLSYVKTNIEGTINVLEAVKHFGISKLVHTSTSETYGTAQYTPINEIHPLKGQSPYSASKIGADKLAESYFLSFNVPVATVRPFNTYGPRQSARAVIPTIISQALNEEEIFLGSLSPVRDLTFVKDTVNGFIAVAESNVSAGKVINIGNGRGITIGDLVVKILQLMDCKKEIRQQDARLRPENSEVFNLICDSKLAVELTGWKPQFTLDDGLRKTIEFVSQNRSFFKTNRYAV